MLLLSRRTLIVGASASAAAGLAGCVNTSPAPPQASLAAVQPNYNEIYAETRDGAFVIPAVEFGQLNPAFLRASVTYPTQEPPGTIVIDPANHHLYHVEGGAQATRYGVGVGAEGFGWSGETTVKSKQEWPDWYPPKEMLDRRPELMQAMAELRSGLGVRGGPRNPLGARAMYLWQGNQDTLYRIHGTNEPLTVGQSFSSGCIRMINQDAVDLYRKTPVGTRVVVLAYPGYQPVDAAHA